MGESMKFKEIKMMELSLQSTEELVQTLECIKEILSGRRD